MSSSPIVQPLEGETALAVMERVQSDLKALASLNPEGVTPSVRRALLDGALVAGKLGDAVVMAMAHSVAATHPRGVGAATRDLARAAGVSQADAERIVATSKVLPDLPMVRQELASGSLSRVQAAVIAEAAKSSPVAEGPLLATAATSDLMGLRVHVDRVLVEGGNAKRNRERAHANRDLRMGTRNGEWWCQLRGPTDLGAEIALALQPFWDQALRDAPKDARESFGAYGFDAMVAMSRAASGGDAIKLKKRRWQGVIRVDATAIRRGYAVPGEVVEIVGVGPIDVDKAVDLLGDATVRVMVKNGHDVASVATVTRYVAPELRLAIAEKTGFECANRECSNTGFIEMDHENDIAWSHETSYRNGHCFCSRCHDLKTRHGYQITRDQDGTISLEPPPPDDHDPP